MGQPHGAAYVHNLPLLGSVVNDYPFSQRYVFYTVSLIFALTGLLALTRLPSHRKRPRGQTEGHDSADRRIANVLHSICAMPRVVVTVFLAFLSVGLLIPVVKLFAMDELRLSEKHFGALLLPVAGVLALLALPLGRLGDKWGKSESVRLGVSLSALAMWMIAGVRWAPGLVLAGSLLGVGFLIAMPAWLALISDMTSSTNRGQVLGAVGMAQGIGAILGAVVAGYLYEGKPRIGGINPHVTPLLLSAVLLTVTAVLTFVLLERKRVEPDTRERC
jgi:MFS family permease